MYCHSNDTSTTTTNKNNNITPKMKIDSRYKKKENSNALKECDRSWDLKEMCLNV